VGKKESHVQESQGGVNHNNNNNNKKEGRTEGRKEACSKAAVKEYEGTGEAGRHRRRGERGVSESISQSV
jgi:hypothetical protein